jgi:putative holliday junction resolvase
MIYLVLMVYLGIDYGSKRIGLALGDSETKVAQPLVTLDATAADYWNRLSKIIRQYNVSELIVGLPRGLDGGETDQTKAVRFFAMELSTLKLPVHLQDEAGTSELARERIGKRLTSKAQIDAEAATIILEDFFSQLEGLSPLWDDKTDEL